ncbi:MAG: DUF6273 domain-containing protein [Treponema sp.]|nr:DUF6273 domain-containing protein [Treponema sp.]
MNNLNRFIAVIIVSLAFVMASSCRLSMEQSQAQKKLFIECETLPAKTAYHVNIDNELLIEGLKIVAEYPDGTTKDVTEYCECDGFDSSMVTENQVITVCYEEEGELYTTEFSISVYTELDHIEIEVESETEGKLVISRGDDLDRSKIKVRAIYDDNSEKLVSGWTVVDFDSSIPGYDQEFVVEYTEGDNTKKTVICVDVMYKFYDAPEYLPAGTDGTIGSNGSYVYFGDYPQSQKLEDVEIDESVSVEVGSNTYYLGSDAYYYFSVTKGAETSWYKVEPLKWRILTDSYNGTTHKLLLAEKVYTTGVPYSKDILVKNIDDNGTQRTFTSNNYEYSDIRAYINSDFKNNVFSVAAQKFILATEVNNGASSGNASADLPVDPKYAASNTTDMMFLLSIGDVSNSNYGFGAPDTEGGRQKFATDYAKKIGAAINTNFSSATWWWLRSPIGESNGKATAYGVNSSGTLDTTAHGVNNATPGIVPAIVIK